MEEQISSSVQLKITLTNRLLFEKSKLYDYAQTSGCGVLSLERSRNAFYK